MSNRSFLRRFKKATSNTPLEYIQGVKIEAANKRLESSILNVQEVLYGVGFIDEKIPKYFKIIYQIIPLDYLSKYTPEMAFS